MRHCIISLSLSFVLAVMVSCDKAPVEEDVTGGYADIELYTSFAVEHLSQDVPATKVSVGDVVKSLDFMIYSVSDGTYEVYQSAQQSAGDEDLGRLSLTHMAYGEYILIAVGHNCSVRARFYSPVQVDFDGKVNETFVAYKRLVVDENTEKGQTLTLTRITSMFVLDVEDAQPAEVATIEFQLAGASTDFNPSTGLGYSTGLTVRTITIDATPYAGMSDRKFLFHMFLPTEDADVSVVANFKDGEGNVLYRRTFPKVPVSVNEKTIYTGSVYSVSSSLSLGIDSKWNGENNYRF